MLLVVTVTYGISQGYASSLSALALSYYWKDVKKLQPAQTQFYMVRALRGWVGEWVVEWAGGRGSGWASWWWGG